MLTQFNANIKAIQLDFWGEFRLVTKLLTEQGIIHMLTYPHTSHQNGVVERKHIQIVEMWLTVLSHATMSISL